MTEKYHGFKEKPMDTKTPKFFKQQFGNFFILSEKPISLFWWFRQKIPPFIWTFIKPYASY